MSFYWRKNNTKKYPFWIAVLALTIQLCFPLVQSHHLNQNHDSQDSLSTGFNFLCGDDPPAHLEHDQSSCLVCLTLSHYSQLILKRGNDWVSKHLIYLSQLQHFYKNPLYSLSPAELFLIRGPPVILT